MQPAIKMALRAARQSSDFLKDRFARLEPATTKPDQTLKMLQAIDETLHERTVEALQRAYPEHRILPPGQADAEGAPQSWHVFPLLGQQNFARGLPEFTTALLQKKDNRPENLVLISPLTGEEYAASRGYGATLNSRRMRGRPAQHLDQTVLSSSLLTRPESSADATLWQDMAAELIRAGAEIRYSGCPSLDLARVAAGNLDAAVLAPIDAPDILIGGLLAQEAGLLSGDARGNPLSSRSQETVIANSAIFREILKRFSPYRQRLAERQ